MPSLTLASARAADFTPVEVEKLRRGRVIVRRRQAHGVHSLRRWAEVTGINRATLGKVESGTGTDEMIERVEAFLGQLDAERGIDTTDLPALEPGERDSEDTIEFDITGPTTKWHVVVRGPVDSADELRRQAELLLRGLDDE